MPRAICGCGASYPLTEDEARQLRGKPFVCPRCAAGSSGKTEKARPARQPPASSAGPGKKSVVPRFAARHPSGPEPIPSPSLAKSPSSALPNLPASAPAEPNTDRIRIVVATPALSVNGLFLRLLLLLALIGVSAWGGWYFFGADRERKIPGVTESVADRSPKSEPDTAAAGNEQAERGEAPEATGNLPARVLPGVVTVVATRGTGSGFFVNDRRTVITNQHVVEAATEAFVVLHDKTRARVLGWTAMLQGGDLVALQLDDASPDTNVLDLQVENPQVGDRVLSCGSPKGLSGTVAEGIVSGIRGVEDLREMYAELGYSADATWIQTTAPISSGNSGGPLVDDRGRVIGIMTCSRRDGQNLNFAIGARHIQEILDAGDTSIKPLSKLPLMKRPRLPPETKPVQRDVTAAHRPARKRDSEDDKQAAQAKVAADKKAAADKAARDEKSAEAIIRAAESLLKAGKQESYRKMLRDVVEKYPETKAANRARELLK